MKRGLLLAALIYFGIVLAGPLLAPYDPLLEVGPSLAPPSIAHPCGTDLIGRDVFSRVLHGGQRTVLVAVLALIVGLPGLLIGLIAGYRGGWPDVLIGLLSNALLAIPGLLLALSIVTVTGNGPLQVAFAVGLAALPAGLRVARAAARDVLLAPYIEGARSIGAPPAHILTRYIMPNTLRSLLAFGAVTLAWAILNAATLNFLGFGGDLATPEWGAMLAEARQVYRVAPWVALAPGAAIMLTLIAINALADSAPRQTNAG